MLKVNDKTISSKDNQPTLKCLCKEHLCVSTFQSYAKVDEVKIVAYAEVVIDKMFNIRQSNIYNDQVLVSITQYILLACWNCW